MPHEKPSLTTEGGLEVDPGYKGRRTSLGMKIGRVHTFVPPEPTKEDLKDPGLEKFPVKKSGILNRMHTLKHQLPIDDSSHLDNDGEDMMQYQLTRSLAHLASNEKPKFSPTFMELTQPKREASTEGTKDKNLSHLSQSTLTNLGPAWSRLTRWHSRDRAHSDHDA